MPAPECNGQINGASRTKIKAAIRGYHCLDEVEVRGVEPLYHQFRQRYATSLFRDLGLTHSPSTDGVIVSQPVGLRPPFPGAKTAAPRFSVARFYHPGLGRSDVAT